MSRGADRRARLGVFPATALLALLLFALTPDTLPFLCVMLTAFGLGGTLTLALTLPLDNARDDGEANSWSALALTVGYLLEAAGPLLVGLSPDTSGGFAASLWLLARVGALMLGLPPPLSAVGETDHAFFR